MVDINGTQYKLCLLDTNAVSEIINNRHEEFKKYLDNLFHDNYIPCFSVFTIAELQQKQELFSKFMDLFTYFPSAIVKGHGQMVLEEIEKYPNYQKIFPIILSLVGMKPYKDYSRRQTVELLFKSEPYTSYRKQYISQRSSVINDIISNSKTFIAEKVKYSGAEIWIYLQTFVLQELFSRNRKFVDIRRRNHLQIDINAFPSVLMMAYTMFYKFYEDRNRQPLESDVFDIVISALVPYMDEFITERHQAEVIKKIRSREKEFLSTIQVYTLRDLREL